MGNFTFCPRDNHGGGGDLILPLSQSNLEVFKEVEVPSQDVSQVDLLLAPVDGGRQAWTFVLSACIFDSFIWGWNNTYGIFQDYYSSHPPFSEASGAEISTIGTVSVAIQYIEVVLIIALFQRYPELPKPAMWISLVICVGSLILSSFATKIWLLILLQGIVFGIGAGVFYAPILIWLSDWFVARRGLAGGIIFGGSGIGGFVLPLGLGRLLNVVGLGWTIRIYAISLGVCGGLALLGVNPRHPARILAPITPRNPWFPKDLSWVRNPIFFCMLGISLVQALGFFPVSIFLPSYVSHLSSETLHSTTVLAIFNVASVLCYVVFGRVCDSCPYPYVIFASGMVSALAAFLILGFASSLPWMFAFTIVFGGFAGGFPGTWPAAASEIGGSRNEITSLMMGCFAVVKGIGAIVGPIIAATLREPIEEISFNSRYGKYGFRRVEIFVGSMGVATCLGGSVLVFYSKSTKRHIPK